MKKTILIIITLFSFSSLNADYLKVGSSYCVSDYWYKDGQVFYYKSSAPGVLISRYLVDETFIDGYVYDSENDICFPEPISQELGIQFHEYKFLMGLMGLLLGFGWLMGLLHIFSRR